MKLALQVVRRLAAEEWGGIETVVVNAARRLPRFGYTAEILATRALAADDGDTVFGVPVSRFDYFYPVLGLSAEARLALDGKGGNPVSFPLYRALLGRREAALVHVHTAGRIAGIARLAARRLRIPYVVTIHGGHFTTPPAEVEAMRRPTRGHIDCGSVFGLMFGSRRVLRDAAAVMCVSKAECEAARRHLPGQRVVHVPNGVDGAALAVGDAARFRAAHGLGDAPIILSVARIDYQKNQLALVRALGRIRERFPSAVCVLAGPVSVPEYHERLRAEAERTGAANAVRFVGALAPESPALADAYAAADVFVLPSRHEPFGIVVLEAWSASKAVVTSRAGGLADLVEHGVTGLCIDPDDPGSIAEAVGRLLADRGLAAALGRAGRERARAFDWDQSTARIASVYDAVLADRAALGGRPATGAARHGGAAV